MKLQVIVVPFLIILLSCGSSDKKSSGNHENLRRYKNHDINEIIISGWEHIHKKNFEWGSLDFKRLIQKNYKDDDILFGAGLAQYYQGLFTDSEKLFTMAIKENPAHFEAIYYRANVYMHLGNRAAAARDFKTIVSLKYSQPLVCGLYFSSNDIAEAHILETRKHEARQHLEGGMP